jgi:hypothetical protein
MNKGSCSNGSNNIYNNYPLIMDDARLFSNYYSSVFNDEMLKRNKNIITNNDYRKYLQYNAEAIIANNQYNSCNECSVCPYYNNKANSTINKNTPYIFDTTLSQIRPYGYETSDLKEIYLSKQQLDSQKHVSKYVINKNP